MAVPFSEFFHRVVSECALVVENKLFPAVVCESRNRNVCHKEYIQRQKCS